MHNFAQILSPDGHVYMGFEASDQAQEFRYKTELADMEPNGPDWVLEIGDIQVPLSVNRGQSSGQIARMAIDILKGTIEAKFVPQAWINDWANEIDGAEYFDIATTLAALPLSKVKAIFGNPGGTDELADNLDAFKKHRGPFEVEVDEEELIRKIALISGQDVTTIAELTTNVWEDFANTFTQIQKAKEAHRQQSGELTAALEVAPRPQG